MSFDPIVTKDDRTLPPLSLEGFVHTSKDTGLDDYLVQRSSRIQEKGAFRVLYDALYDSCGFVERSIAAVMQLGTCFGLIYPINLETCVEDRRNCRLGTSRVNGQMWGNCWWGAGKTSSNC
jgi:hypothetical protein